MTSTTTKFCLRFKIHSDGHAFPPSSLVDPYPHTSFNQFGLLPAELRLQIWAHLLLPRIVRVSCHDITNEGPARQATEYAPPAPPSTSSSQPSSQPRFIPVLLHVNHESRSLALSRYELAFSWKVPDVLADVDLLSPSSPDRPTWSAPRVYFDFARDIVYLDSELEPCTSSGFNSPLTYFLSRADAARVRRVAVAFGALAFGESGSSQVFGTLFHVVDRLRPASGRVLVCVSEADEWTHALMGGDAPLVRGDPEAGGVIQAIGELGLGDEVDAREMFERYQRRVVEMQGGGEEVNLVQKIWRDWSRRSIVTPTLAGLKFELIREAELERYMNEEET